MRRRVLISVVLCIALVAALLLWPWDRLNSPSYVIRELMSLKNGWYAIDWIGGRKLVLTVRVVDDADGQPIAGATVRLFRGLAPESKDPNGRTAADGLVGLTQEFTTTGYDAPFKHISRVSLWDQRLAVDAKGYEPLLTDLTNYAPWSLNSRDLPLPVAEVRLVRKK
jgi:hypothetical protein